ncbi:MAG TPA: hypothetical protein VIY29_19635, partial [Ktedonobacteraceae bacterium]
FSQRLEPPHTWIGAFAFLGQYPFVQQLYSNAKKTTVAILAECSFNRLYAPHVFLQIFLRMTIRIGNWLGRFTGVLEMT